MLESAKRNLDIPELAKVMDDDFGVADFLSVTKEDLTARGKLRPIGARHYAARAQLIQNIIGLFNSPIGQMISPHISAKQLAKMVEEYMGFEAYEFIKDNAAIFENAETQKLAMSAQQEAQMQAQEPIEDDLNESVLQGAGLI